jgi:hypothetical protein
MLNTSTTSAPRTTLRNLPLAVRLVLATFLISVGLGYISAMIQLHFQHSSKSGSPLPSSRDVVKHFHGETGPQISALERLITAPEDGIKGGAKGTMSAAFTSKSKPARGFNEVLRPEREGEKKAVLAWVRAGAPRLAYLQDAFVIPAGLEAEPITPKYSKASTWKVKSILTDRCVRCHRCEDSDDDKASAYPMETYEDVAKFAKPSRGFMSIEKLTQTTHLHLLSFSMLYAMTGLIFAWTSYPGFLRGLLAPLVLVAQMADISCWWLARLEGPVGQQFAMAIMVTGAIVGIGLVLQIVLSLFNMFGVGGKLILLVLFAAAAGGGYVAYTNVIGPELRAEKEEAEATRLQQENTKNQKAAQPEKKPDKEEK